MALSANDRAVKIRDAIAASNPNWGKLSADEKTATLNNLVTVFGADLQYLVQTTTVNVNTSSTIQTATIQTTGGPSNQVGPSAPLAVSGTGSGTIS